VRASPFSADHTVRCGGGRALRKKVTGAPPLRSLRATTTAPRVPYNASARPNASEEIWDEFLPLLSTRRQNASAVSLLCWR
jgi:hypothetical protein